MNEEARDQMGAAETIHLQIVPGATHLLQESGALEQVSDLAQKWFKKYLA